MDIGDTIQAKSDQLNAVDLAQPITVTIERVEVTGGEQPVNIYAKETPGRAYRPSKSMRRVLVACWGARSAEYVGRRLTLYNEPTVTWAGQQVGGIRISHASHIDGPVTAPLALAKGKRGVHKVLPIPAIASPPAQSDNPIPAMRTADEYRAHWQARKAEGAPPAELDAIYKAAQAITTEETNV